VISLKVTVDHLAGDLGSIFVAPRMATEVREQFLLAHHHLAAMAFSTKRRVDQWTTSAVNDRCYQHRKPAEH
jgi:hypothetical protein